MTPTIDKRCVISVNALIIMPDAFAITPSGAISLGTLSTSCCKMTTAADRRIGDSGSPCGNSSRISSWSSSWITSWSSSWITSWSTGWETCWGNGWSLMIIFMDTLVILPQTFAITPRSTIALRTFRARICHMTPTIDKRCVISVNALIIMPDAFAITPSGAISLGTLSTSCCKMTTAADRRIGDSGSPCVSACRISSWSSSRITSWSNGW